MRESDIERYLVQRVEALGGTTRKVLWVNHVHAPDRRVMLPGRCMWVELKAPGEKPSPGQLREHARMTYQGERVEVIDSMERVDEVLGA